MRRVVVTILVGASVVVLGGCAVTEPATNVTSHSAELNAGGTYDGSAGHLEFEYSTNPADIGSPRAKQTPVTQVASKPASTPGTFSQTVDGLQPATGYYYAVCGADATIPQANGRDRCGGSYQFKTLLAPQQITINAAQTQVTLSTPGAVATFAFSGKAGQVVVPWYSVGNGPGSVIVSILDPSGNQLTSSNLAYALSVDGTYTVVVTNRYAPNNLSLGVYAAGSSTTTENGRALDVPIIAGQKTTVSFAASAGDEISALTNLESYTYSSSRSPTVTLEDSAGNSVPGITPGQQPGLFGPATLPTSSTYQLAFDSHGSTALLSLKLYKIVNQTGTITVNGPAVTATSSTPGQTSTFSFSGTAGESVGLTFGPTTYGDYPPWGVKIESSDGQTVSGDNYVYTLPTSGTYDVVVDSQGPGTASLSLSSPPIQTPPGTIIANGPLVDVTVPTETSTASVTFKGTAGEHVTVTAAVVNIISEQGPPTLSIKDAAGKVLSSGQLGAPPVTLPSDGTYTIELDGAGQAAGTASLHLTTP